MDSRTIGSGGTRGRIVALLRRGSHSVEELAVALGVTDNAVRAQLAALERDGVVEMIGVRRDGAVGKPARLYGIAPEAEPLFSRAYEPVLGALLSVVAERAEPEELDDLLRAVGRRLAASLPSPSGDLEQRVRAAADVLTALGGDVEVEQASDRFVIRGFACPLSRVVDACPATCTSAEELVAGLTGATVHERCDRSSGRPRCTFEVMATGKARR